jgi:hypothetical protein
LRTSEVDVAFLFGVGPFALGAAPLPPALNVSAIDCASFALSAFSDAPAIILRILGSDACSSAFWLLIFFRRSAAVEAAAAILAARAGGSSRTCSYSLRMRAATLAWSAAVDGAGVLAVIENAEFGAWSSAPDDAKSAANISLVRFADARTSCSVELGIGAVVAMSWVLGGKKTQIGKNGFGDSYEMLRSSREVFVM